MVIFTTNHIENIPEAALRPGRLDHLIHIQPPDAEAAARLVLHYGGNEIDRMNFDPVAVGKAVQGYIPAIIAEVMKRAKLSALTAMPMELGGDNHLLPVLPTSLKIGTEAIQIAAKSIKQHAEMVNRQQVAEPSDLEKMSHIVGNYIARGVIKAVDHVGSDKLDLHFRKVTGVTDGRGLATDNE
jgi:SpoVK/Ycf46/Vps4 family AAA+-type ATPase